MAGMGYVVTKMDFIPVVTTFPTFTTTTQSQEVMTMTSNNTNSITRTSAVHRHINFPPASELPHKESSSSPVSLQDQPTNQKQYKKNGSSSSSLSLSLYTTTTSSSSSSRSSSISRSRAPSPYPGRLGHQMQTQVPAGQPRQASTVTAIFAAPRPKGSRYSHDLRNQGRRTHPPPRSNHTSNESSSSSSTRSYIETGYRVPGSTAFPHPPSNLRHELKSPAPEEQPERDFQECQDSFEDFNKHRHHSNGETRPDYKFTTTNPAKDNNSNSITTDTEPASNEKQKSQLKSEGQSQQKQPQPQEEPDIGQFWDTFEDFNATHVPQGYYDAKPEPELESMEQPRRSWGFRRWFGRAH